MATATAGLVTRMAKCQEHGIEYVELFHPRIPGQESFTSGQCPQCAEDEKLSAAAYAQLQRQYGQIAQEVFQMTQERESEIEQLVQNEFDAYVERQIEEARQNWPMFEAVARQNIWNAAWEQVAGREFDKIVAQLRAAEREG